MKQKNIIYFLILACRPKQWTKNLLVFAGPIFDFRFENQIFISAFAAFLSFCLVSSSIYLLNDCIDIESDRKHPKKKFRPIAAGKVSKLSALIFSIILLLFSITITLGLSKILTAVIIFYFLIQLIYCLRLKREPILDIFCIASGFLLRAIAGIAAASLPNSPWFLLTIGLLALFLAIEKRKAELRLSQKRGVLTRSVLKRYSLPLLLRFESLVSTSSFVTYSLWASGPILKGASTSLMMLTIPFVLAGIFRYQLLSDPDESERRIKSKKDNSSERPEEILLNDNGIKFTIFGWFITTIVIGLFS